MTPDETPTVPPAAPLPAAPEPIPSGNDADKKDIEENKDIAAFSYLWIMSVIVYFARGKRSPFIAYHSKQAIVIFILSLIFAFVPVISRLLELFILGLMVWGFMNAVQGKRKDIPIIGPLSRREIGPVEAIKQVAAIFQGWWAKLKPFIQKPTTKSEPPKTDTPPTPPSENPPPTPPTP
jgi:uncharacterized membrane protein